MLFKRFELSIYRNLTELCSAPAWAVLLVHRSMSNAPSSNVCRHQEKFERCKLLLELFRLIAMNCGQKLFNPPSCAARLQQMTMTCDRITKYELCSSGAIVAHNHGSQSKHYPSALWNSSFRCIIVQWWAKWGRWSKQILSKQILS